MGVPSTSNEAKCGSVLAACSVGFIVASSCCRTACSRGGCCGFAAVVDTSHCWARLIFAIIELERFAVLVHLWLPITKRDNDGEPNREYFCEQISEREPICVWERFCEHFRICDAVGGKHERHFDSVSLRLVYRDGVGHRLVYRYCIVLVEFERVSVPIYDWVHVQERLLNVELLSERDIEYGALVHGCVFSEPIAV